MGRRASILGVAVILLVMRRPTHIRLAALVYCAALLTRHLTADVPARMTEGRTTRERRTKWPF